MQSDRFGVSICDPIKGICSFYLQLTQSKRFVVSVFASNRYLRYLWLNQRFLTFLSVTQSKKLNFLSMTKSKMFEVSVFDPIKVCSFCDSIKEVYSFCVTSHFIWQPFDHRQSVSNIFKQKSAQRWRHLAIWPVYGGLDSHCLT